MLIYDKFASRKTANEFCRQVKVHHSLDTTICKNDREAQELDPHPWESQPLIVLVERPDLDDLKLEIEIENDVTKLARLFGGEFAGT